MSDAVPPAADNGHLLRPGVVLFWGQALESACLPADSLLFVFTLAAGEQGGRDRMMLALRRLEPDAGFRVAVALTPAALRDLLAEDRTVGAAHIRRFAAGQPGASVELPLTPSARLAVESIRRCPFVGACRQMAFAARAHDLLLEFFSALTAAEAPRRPIPTRALIARIHAAGETLKRNLEAPPTLAALARDVGLGETTLKRGFHQVFGTTVFGYLRACRMERARHLLATGEATVLEAAAMVGYSNPSNFAAAFRRQFGLNPKAFQLDVHR